MRGTSTTFSGPVTKKRDCSFGGGDGTKGDCFSISASLSVTEEKANCYSVSTDNRPCFYIKCEESYDETIAPTPEEIDLEGFGFSDIKCIQAHGDNSIKIIGLYTPPGGEETPVLADLLYMKGTESGIYQAYSVYQFVPLSTLGMTDYNLVSRLDGYDVKSNLSSICIVYDGDVYWLNPVSLMVSHSSAGYLDSPVNDPYFNEDDYYVGVRAVHDQWLPEMTQSECGQWRKSDGVCDGTYEPYQITAGTSTLSYVTTADQTDGTEKLLGEGYTYVWTDGNGIPTTTIGVVRKRKDLVITSNSKALFDVNNENGPSVWAVRIYGETATHIYMERYQFTGVLFGDTEPPTLDATGATGIKLAYDGKFIAYVYGSDTVYKSKDGAITGTVAGVNSTLVNGAILIADGTAVIKQTPLQ